MRSSPSREGELVAKYFDDNARSFDSIYDDEQKSAWRRWRDKVTRGTVRERLEYVDRLAASRHPKRVLDVGCGAGRFAFRLAPRVEEVVGLDFAPEMIALANDKAAEAGVADKCRFYAVDFLTWDAGAPYDLALAIGVVDYVADPGPLLAKLSAVSGGNVVVSFPRRYHYLVPLRYLRLRMAGCPVHFYDRGQVEAFGRAHLPRFAIEKLGRDYLLVGNR